MLRQLEKSQQLGEVPQLPETRRQATPAILKKHSDKHTYITLTLAIRLWKERAQPETTHMRAFSELPDPFKPGHKASETLKFVQHGPIADPRAAQSHLDGLLTAPSTGEAIITKKQRFMCAPGAASPLGAPVRAGEGEGPLRRD